MTHEQPNQVDSTANTEQATADSTPPVDSPVPPDTAAEPDRAELLLRLQRVTADFQNYQRRIQKEKQDAGKFAVGDFVKALLPALDNLQRALAVPASSDDAKALNTGVRMVAEQIVTTFARQGIKPIGTVGEPFDPAVHHAIMQQAGDAPAMTVLHVVEPGYVSDGHTLRAAKVVVCSGPQPASQPAAPAAE